MIPGVTNQGLEVLHFEDVASTLLRLDMRSDFLLFNVLDEQLLDRVIAHEVFLFHSEDLVRLFLSNEAAFDSQALLCDLLTSFVAVSCLLHSVLFLPVPHQLLSSGTHGFWELEGTVDLHWNDG